MWRNNQRLLPNARTTSKWHIVLLKRERLRYLLVYCFERMILWKGDWAPYGVCFRFSRALVSRQRWLLTQVHRRLTHAAITLILIRALHIIIILIKPTRHFILVARRLLMIVSRRITNSMLIIIVNLIIQILLMRIINWNNINNKTSNKYSNSKRWDNSRCNYNSHSNNHNRLILTLHHFLIRIGIVRMLFPNMKKLADLFIILKLKHIKYLRCCQSLNHSVC